MKTTPRPQTTSSGVPPLPLPDERGTWRTILVMAAVIGLLYFVTARPIAESDNASRSAFALTASIVNDRTLAIDHYTNGPGGTPLLNAADYPNAAYFNGHYYTDLPPGLSFAAVPFYLLGNLLDNAAVFGLGFMALLGAGAVLLTYKLARRVGAAEKSARFAALTLGLGSAMWREGARFGPGALTVVLMLAALLMAIPPLPRELAQDDQTGRDKLTLRRGLPLGLVLGYAVVTEYSNAVWVLLILAYLEWSGQFGGQSVRNTVRGLVGLVVGLLVGVAPLVAYNSIIFGKFWAFTYAFSFGNASARTLTGYYFGGFKPLDLWAGFLSGGTALFGPFLLYFGVVGLFIIIGQRAKREMTILLLAIIIAVLIFGLLRNSTGPDAARVDYLVGLLPPLSVGAAVWYERFQFFNRLEFWWWPSVSIAGMALFYIVTAGGPLRNLLIVPVLWPLLLIGWLLMLLNWQRTRSGRTVTVIVAIWVLTFCGLSIGSLNHFADSLGRPTFNDASNLFSGKVEVQNYSRAQVWNYQGWYVNGEPKSSNQRLSGAAVLQPYLVPVQGGQPYGLNFDVNAAQPTAFTIEWVWQDDGHDILPYTFSQNFSVKQSYTTIDEMRAAPPGAAYLQLNFKQTGGEAVYESFSVWQDTPRIEAMPNFATSAVSFSFDWESAMGGLIHSRGADNSVGESGGAAAGDNNQQAVVQNAVQRGLEMRQGANNLMQLFAKYKVRGTFYATGYNLLDGNTGRQKYVNWPTYSWAGPPNWPNDYWQKTPWYVNDPFGTFKTDPAWYFGDQTDALQTAGQEIASHTFGHVLVRAIKERDIEQWRNDIEAWVGVAREKGIEASSFAFPWKGSNSLTPAYYDQLRELGFKYITRLNDAQQGAVVNEKGGTLTYTLDKNDANGRPISTTLPAPTNYYYYLDRIHYNINQKVSTDPRFTVLKDYQMGQNDRSLETAKGVIDQLMQRRGGYGSIWTHPEAITQNADVARWEQIVAYAASQRDKGLWVDGVQTILQYREDAAKIQMQTERVGEKALKITLTNPTANSIAGLTLTLPKYIVSAEGAAKIKGNQFIAPDLAPHQTVTIVVKFN